MKRQKIKRYQFSVTRSTRRRKPVTPLRAAGVVLLCLCVLAGTVFGVRRAVRSHAAGWKGEGLHRYFISPDTGLRVQGLYEISHKLYYFGSDGFLKTGWVRQDGYVGHADEEGKLAQGEVKVDGKYYYFQPATGQLYTGWITLDGADYCFDDTGHPRTGLYQEDGKSWQLDSDGRVTDRLNGWKTENGVLRYYDSTGALAQGWTKLGDQDYYFVDGVSQAGWVDTDAGRRYLDGSGSVATGWCVIDGQPYAFTDEGELKQGWDHSHGKSYYFTDGISQSGVFQEGGTRCDLNGSGSVQPTAEAAPEEDLSQDAEGEPPTEDLLEQQPAAQPSEPSGTTQTETPSAGETAPAAQPETPAAEPEPAAPAETEPAAPADTTEEGGDAA